MKKSIIPFNLASMQVQVVGQYIFGLCGEAEMAVVFDTTEEKMREALNEFGFRQRLLCEDADVFSILSMFIWFLSLKSK